MKIQTPAAACLAIMPYYNQNINTQPPNPNPINSSFLRKICSSLMEELQRHYTTEQLLTITFFQIMIMISTIHLVVGFELLETTDLPKSISPIAISIFKYSLAIFTSFSISSVDLHRRLFKARICKMTIFSMYVVLPLAHFLSPTTKKYRSIFRYIIGNSYMACMEILSTGLGGHGWHVKYGFYLFTKTIGLPIGVRVNTSSNFMIVILFFSNTFSVAASSNLDIFTTCAPSLHCFIDKRVQKLLPVATAQVKSALNKKKEIWKLVKYAIGLVGTLIFQNIFRLTTFIHVKAFMYLAMSWLANLSLINATDDFGIFNFLLGNVILGSTVSQYGLEITTWFTYGVCVFLYILGIKLKTMKTSQNIENLTRPPFLVWIFYCCVVFDSLFNLFHQIN